MSKTARRICMLIAALVLLAVAALAFRAYGSPEMLINLFNLRSCAL